MKKVLFAIPLLFTFLQISCAGDIITHDAKKLPVNARTFISTYFTRAQISHIKIESELFQTKKFEVLLTDRTEIDFDRNGEWIEIDCDHSRVPLGVIPAYISEYLKTNFPGVFITKIERKRREIEVDLSNDWSLTFNNKGKLIEIDD